MTADAHKNVEDEIGKLRWELETHEVELEEGVREEHLPVLVLGALGSFGWSQKVAFFPGLAPLFADCVLRADLVGEESLESGANTKVAPNLPPEEKVDVELGLATAIGDDAFFPAFFDHLEFSRHALDVGDVCQLELVVASGHLEVGADALVSGNSAIVLL